MIVGGLKLFLSYRKQKELEQQLHQKNLEIEKLQNEKALLFREVNHRVKNNLQFITSLLNLQGRYEKDARLKSLLLESRNRINSMSIVHQKIEQENSSLGVDMRIYTQTLIDSLFFAFKVNKHEIKVIQYITPLHLNVDWAMPIGIILNELISNIIKHAYPESKKGSISITLKVVNQVLEIVVRDNGVGLNEGFNVKKSNSFGLQLVHSMVEQLKGDIRFVNEFGLIVNMQFTEYKKGLING